MALLVIDQSQNKLSLIPELFETLLRVEPDVFVESKDSFLAQNLPGIELAQNASPQILQKAQRVIVYDGTQEPTFSSEEILFPVWPKEKEQDYFSLDVNALKVPLGQTERFGFRLGDWLSLHDFLLRLRNRPVLKGRKVLVSGGPTAEDIDPVRFITNRSSGKMGIALARAAFICGAEANLVLGPTGVTVPAYLQCTRVRSAKQMANAVISKFEESDVYIGAAAIADFTPREVRTQKIKKQGSGFNLELTRTPDILEQLKTRRKAGQVLVGFSVETENEIENSRKKLTKKELDLIVINNPRVKGAAFWQDTNKVTVLTASGDILDWPVMPKLQLGLKLMNLIAKYLATREERK